MSSLFRSSIRDGLWVGGVLGFCMTGATAWADTCSNGNVQSAQANTATTADIQLMEQAGTFVFGTVMDVAGAGAVESVFAAALGQGVSGASTDVVGAELDCQQAEITQINGEVTALQSNVATLGALIANQTNTNLANNVATDNQRLQTDVASLNPLSAPPPRLANGTTLATRIHMGPAASGANSPPIDLNTVRVVAVDAQGLADLYLKQFVTRWIGDDVDTAGAAPTAHFEPYPALHTYFLALQVWLTAMTLEEKALGASGFATIKSEYGADLARHRNFLKSRASGGQGASNSASDAGYDPLPDQITKQVSCKWTLGNPYPSGGQCAAYPTCSDNIQPGKSWKTTQTFVFSAPNNQQMCQIDSSSLPPIDAQTQIYQHYGLTQVSQMELIVDSMYRTGDMSVSTTASTGSFGGNAGAPLSIYTLDAKGTLFHEAASGNQPLSSPQPIASGWAGVRSLLPGGGPTFYTVTQNGALNWYSFTSTAPSGPVQLASNFGAYKAVFGAGDGIIYAIGPDGTLHWYHHGNVATGGGPSSLSAPKTVGSGWNQYAFVFAAGSGVIYAVQNDGTVLWLRHLDYLTGDSIQASTPKSATPGRPLDRRVPTLAEAHWEGPIKVASGWTGLRSVMAAGGGVILAVKNDGSLLWYKHDNYLAGASSPTPTVQNTGSLMAQAGRTATAPSWGAMGSTASASGGGGGGFASGWRSPTSVGTPAGGAQPPPTGVVSSLSRSRTFGSESAQISGTQPSTPLTGSSLNGSSFNGSSLNGSSLNGSSLNAKMPTGTATNAVVQPVWEGPITMGSGWQQYPVVAAVLPTTVNAPIH